MEISNLAASHRNAVCGYFKTMTSFPLLTAHLSAHPTCRSIAAYHAKCAAAEQALEDRGLSLFVKNLGFATTTAGLTTAFAKSPGFKSRCFFEREGWQKNTDALPSLASSAYDDYDAYDDYVANFLFKFAAEGRSTHRAPEVRDGDDENFPGRPQAQLRVRAAPSLANVST